MHTLFAKKRVEFWQNIVLYWMVVKLCFFRSLMNNHASMCRRLYHFCEQLLVGERCPHSGPKEGHTLGKSISVLVFSSRKTLCFDLNTHGPLMFSPLCFNLECTLHNNFHGKYIVPSLKRNHFHDSFWGQRIHNTQNYTPLRMVNCGVCQWVNLELKQIDWCSDCNSR